MLSAVQYPLNLPCLRSCPRCEKSVVVSHKLNRSSVVGETKQLGYQCSSGWLFLSGPVETRQQHLLCDPS